MHYNVIGNESAGWLLVFYTKNQIGRRTVFEISHRITAPRAVAVAMAQRRLKELRQAADGVGGDFPK